MSEQDTQRSAEDHPRDDDHATRLVSPNETPDQSGGGSAGASPRVDDRNDELEGSPVPDPEANDAGAEDDPQAD